MPTVNGGNVAFRAETVCLHSYSPDAVELLAALSRLTESGLCLTEIAKGVDRVI